MIAYFYRVSFFLLFLFLNFLFAFQQTGIIKGRIVDLETKSALIGANVLVDNTNMGAASDDEGYYTIKNIPAGNYTLQFSYIGYETIFKADVIVRPNRLTVVDAELKISIIESKAVEVTGSFFEKNEQNPVSVTAFSREEIRRAPGSAGDVSRILMSLPSLAKVNDQLNSLIVRGGSPMENAFYIDNIEIPDINHFQAQGATGGPIGLLNVDFIENVSFSAGGFGASYGDRLSSVMDITFREGNRENYDTQLDFNFAGFGGVVEGPLTGEKGSFMISLRRSYLDLLVDAFDIGTSVAPRYGDYQGKLVYDLSPKHKLSILTIVSDDHNNPDKEAALENDMIVYGNQDIYKTTAGINWRALWANSGYSNTSVSYSCSRFSEDFIETNTDQKLITKRSLEQEYRLRNSNHFRLNQKHRIEFGMEIKHLNYSYDNFFSEYTDALGDTTAQFSLNKNFAAQKFGLFVNYIVTPFQKITTTFGLRGDYFSYNEHFNLAPRFSFSYAFTKTTSLNGSAGLYYQNLPLILAGQRKENKNLKDPKSIHYILGIEHLLTESTRFTIEAYQKEYSNFPVDPAQLTLFLIDELFYRYGFFFNHGPLKDNGEARSRGIEITLQKKLASDFYGLISGSWSKAEYKDANGLWRDRVFDNRFVFSVEGGYKPNNKWEYSLRWIYAGGAPYTPLDIEKSRSLNRAVQDEKRINQARYPDYHSMNIRVDKRFHFNATNLVAYFSIWNVYNQKNIATYFWNENENKKDVIYQWSMLPILGIEFEF